jgi:hypothetical protein
MYLLYSTPRQKKRRAKQRLEASLLAISFKMSTQPILHPLPTDPKCWICGIPPLYLGEIVRLHLHHVLLSSLTLAGAFSPFSFFLFLVYVISPFPVLSIKELVSQALRPGMGR